MQLTTPPIMIGRATDAFRSIDVPFGNIVNTLRRKQLIVAGNATTKPPNSSPPLYDRPSVDAQILNTNRLNHNCCRNMCCLLAAIARPSRYYCRRGNLCKSINILIQFEHVRWSCGTDWIDDRIPRLPPKPIHTHMHTIHSCNSAYWTRNSIKIINHLVSEIEMKANTTNCVYTAGTIKQRYYILIAHQ